MSEPFAYRENLEQILEFSGGRNLLSITEVGRFTGLVDQRAIKRRYPFINGKISAATLARCMCGGGKQRCIATTPPSAARRWATV